MIRETADPSQKIRSQSRPTTVSRHCQVGIQLLYYMYQYTVLYCIDCRKAATVSKCVSSTVNLVVFVDR